MAPRGPLPPFKDPRDQPPWKENLDTVPRRTANAAWAALFERDWADITFKDLAKEVGVTTPALYHYYPTLSRLGCEMARASLAKLRAELVDTFNDAIDDGKRPQEILYETLRAYWAFARKRPRHFGLAFAPDFSNDEQVGKRRDGIREVIETTLAVVTENEAVRKKGRDVWAIVHGGAAIIAMGKPLAEDHLMAVIAQYVVVLDAAPRHS
jgi:AcrR family transcriptional regulator